MRTLLICFLFFHLIDSTEVVTPQQCIHHQMLWKRAVENAPPYPEEKYEGKGIVVCAGNPIYLINAWVHLNFLREIGCELPVELWYYGDEEICASFIELFSTIDVECLDLKPIYPNLNMGFQFKPFAVIASKFQEVLLLDADNLPLENPASCFDWPQYQQWGAVFWPDLHMIKSDNPIWQVLNLTPPSLAFSAQESGQVLVDKKRCWLPLQLTLHMNEHNDFYYHLLWGDKDTFQLAWKALNKSYFFVPFYPAITLLGAKSFIQRHPNGSVLFYHMAGHKFKNIHQDYRLEKQFYLIKEPYRYPNHGYLHYHIRCLFPDGNIVKRIQNSPIFNFHESQKLEIRANQLIQQIRDCPILMDWIIENKDRRTSGSQHFRLRY